MAMLSFSTLGSADHETVRRVSAATSLVRKRAPELAVEGGLQFDAAVLASVAHQKAPGSQLQATPTSSSFPTSPRATSATRSPNGLEVRRNSGRSSRACERP